LTKILIFFVFNLTGLGLNLTGLGDLLGLGETCQVWVCGGDCFVPRNDGAGRETLTKFQILLRFLTIVKVWGDLQSVIIQIGNWKDKIPVFIPNDIAVFNPKALEIIYLFQMIV